MFVLSIVFDFSPGSGSSNFSFNRGKEGLNASGNFKKILYKTKHDFFLRYGRALFNIVTTSAAKSRAKSGVQIFERQEMASPASYKFGEVIS